MSETTLPRPVSPYAPPTAHTSAFATMYRRLTNAIESDGPDLNLISSQSAPTDAERGLMKARLGDLNATLTPIADRGASVLQALIERVLRMFYAWPTVKLDEMKAIGVAKAYAEQVAHLPLWAVDAGIVHCQAQNEPFPPSAGMLRAACETKIETVRAEIIGLGRILGARVVTEQPRGADAIARVRHAAEEAKMALAAVPPLYDNAKRDMRLPSRFDAPRAGNPGGTPTRLSDEAYRTVAGRERTGWTEDAA